MRLLSILFVSSILTACGGGAPEAVSTPAPEQPAVTASADAATPDAAASTTPDAAPAEVWACPMHADVTASGPGKCSTCGMDLVVQAPKP